MYVDKSEVTADIQMFTPKREEETWLLTKTTREYGQLGIRQ